MTTPTTVQVKFQLRGDTAANWASVNPVLLNNELGLETDTKKLKVGNGSTAWNSLAYFPSIVTGGTVLGNLEIGTTGTLTFEGSTADGFETTLGVINPTADRTINLPNQSGTVVVSGNATIVDADIAANAEIAVSKLAYGAARQLLQTDAAGTGVEWTSNVDVPGTLDVTSTATFDSIAQHPLGTAGAPTITFSGDTNTGLYSPGADQVAISTNGTERARIDSSGRLLVGTSSAYFAAASAVTAPLTQTHGTNANLAQLLVGSWATGNNVGGSITLARSNSGTIGNFGSALGTLGVLGNIRFNGSDGTKFVEGAKISAVVDGGWDTDDAPTRLEFSTTADGASSPTERLRITSAGVLQVADAGNITVGTTTGTKIGTATTQKLGFYNATPVVQPSAVADATTAVDVITQLNALLAKLRTLGIIAT